jgi:hypothetical protein
MKENLNQFKIDFPPHKDEKGQYLIDFPEDQATKAKRIKKDKKDNEQNKDVQAEINFPPSARELFEKDLEQFKKDKENFEKNSK